MDEDYSNHYNELEFGRLNSWLDGDDDINDSNEIFNIGYNDHEKLGRDIAHYSFPYVKTLRFIFCNILSIEGLYRVEMPFL